MTITLNQTKSTAPCCVNVLNCVFSVHRLARKKSNMLFMRKNLSLYPLSNNAKNLLKD